MHNSSINFLFLDYNTCVVGSQNKRHNVVPQKRSKIDELENIHNPTHKNVYLIHHARIQEFSLGGVPVKLTKKYDNIFFIFFYLVLSLFCRSQMVNFKENYHFQSSGGGPTFSRGGGSNRSFTIETHITCGFPGGPDPLSPPPPPLDPHLTMVHQVSRHWYESSLFPKERK